MVNLKVIRTNNYRTRLATTSRNSRRTKWLDYCSYSWGQGMQEASTQSER